jgi:hypothetical protein
MARHKKPPPDVGFWTERDLSQAREWKRVGFSISAIAKALGKEVDKVQNKWDDDGFGLAVLPKAVRKCITCTTPFESDGPHNRMCDRCREKLTNASSTIGDFEI